MSNQLTENFSRKEFECSCGCGFDTVDYQLAVVLQDERDAFATKYGRVKLVITGGNRCPSKNAATPGAALESQHIYARGADHKVFFWHNDGWAQVPPEEQYELLDNWYPNSCGLGIYVNRVHFDSRADKARWDKR